VVLQVLGAKPDLLYFWKDFFIGSSRNLLDEARKVSSRP